MILMISDDWILCLNYLGLNSLNLIMIDQVYIWFHWQKSAKLEQSASLWRRPSVSVHNEAILSFSCLEQLPTTPGSPGSVQCAMAVL